MKVWKLGDLRITNENAIVFTKQASWRFERASVSTGLCRVKAHPKLWSINSPRIVSEPY